MGLKTLNALFFNMIEMRFHFLSQGIVSQGRYGKFEPGKAQYSIPNFFDRLFLKYKSVLKP
jgi:hypothetical protein